MDFAQALKERRASRRLSQLELALRAGTTQRHLSFIESGRSAPGRDMVIRLAESLGLPLRERNELLLKAGYAPAYPQTPLDGPGIAPVMSALTHVLDAHLPYPAVVVARHGDIVAANAGLDILAGGCPPHLRGNAAGCGKIVTRMIGGACLAVDPSTGKPLPETERIGRILAGGRSGSSSAIAQALERWRAGGARAQGSRRAVSAVKS